MLRKVISYPGGSKMSNSEKKDVTLWEVILERFHNNPPEYNHPYFFYDSRLGLTYIQRHQEGTFPEVYYVVFAENTYATYLFDGYITKDNDRTTTSSLQNMSSESRDALLELISTGRMFELNEIRSLLTELILTNLHNQFQIRNGDGLYWTHKEFGLLLHNIQKGLLFDCAQCYKTLKFTSKLDFSFGGRL